MSRINIRNKGLVFERFIAKVFRSLGYPEAHRQLEFQINHAHGIDLANTGLFAVQCKKTKKYVSMNTIQEVKCKPDQIPLLIAAGDNQEPLVTMPLWAFMALSDWGFCATKSNADYYKEELSRLRNSKST